MKNIYYLGNVILKEDNVTHKLIPQLEKQFPQFNFIHLDPTEEMPESENNQLIFLDTIVGINKVKVFHSLRNFVSLSRISVHDYDLYLDLSLKIKLGNITKFTLIGVPQNQPLKFSLNQIRIYLLAILSSENAKHRTCKGRTP